jgi:hypothetical protein
VGFAVRLLEGVIKERGGGKYVHRELMESSNSCCELLTTVLMLEGKEGKEKRKKSQTLDGGLSSQNQCLVQQVGLLEERMSK